MIVRRGIRAPGQRVRLCRVAQRVTDCSRPHAGILLGRIKLENVMHVLGPVDHDSNVATLPGKTGAASTRKHRRTKLAGRRHGLHNILSGLRDYYADRNLPIVGSIGGIQRLAAGVETDFPFNVLLQFLL